MGYSEAELAPLPEGADLGLGCGNPQALAAMRPGEVVVDLGGGAGIDCFLAARLPRSSISTPQSRAAIGACQIRGFGRYEKTSGAS